MSLTARLAAMIVIALFATQLVNGALWLVNLPESGNVHVTTAVLSNM